jgi:hypothetical protein
MIEVVYGFEDILMVVIRVVAWQILVRLKVAWRNLASCTTAAKKGREIGTTEPASIADFFPR